MGALVDIALPYFLARPARDAPGPGVVVIHEGNGISPQLLRVCQRLAAEGYGVIAPDLFYRAGGTEAGDGTGDDDVSVPELANSLAPAKARKATKASGKTVKRKRR